MEELGGRKRASISETVVSFASVAAPDARLNTIGQQR